VNHTKNRLRVALACAAATLALSACLDEPTRVDAGSLPDAQTPDGEVTDARTADAREMDAGTDDSGQ